MEAINNKSAFICGPHVGGLAVLLMLVALFCYEIPGAIASQTESLTKAPAPELSIKSYFHGMKKHNKSEPLLLRITLSNPDAYNVAMHNQQFGKIDPQPVPVVNLGSNTVPLVQLINVMLLPKDASKPATKAALLAQSKHLPPALELDGSNSLAAYYGLDRLAISALPPSIYTVRVSLDSRSQQGMWQGQISEEFDLELVEGEPGNSAGEQASLAYGYGKFYLLDRQFDKVEPHAKWLEQHDANSIGAAELRGDAALASGQYQRAVDFFREAIRRAELRQSAYSEPPVYLHQRLEQANALLKKAQ